MILNGVVITQSAVPSSSSITILSDEAAMFDEPLYENHSFSDRTASHWAHDASSWFLLISITNNGDGVGPKHITSLSHSK